MFNIENYFTHKELSKTVYKLPEGFEKGITKLQFIRSQNTSFGSTRLALLTNGVLVVVEIPSEDATYEESKCDYSDVKDKPLRIILSIKFPHQSILDFDIDRNGYYAAIYSSERNVKIYELDTTEKSDVSVTNQKLKNCSRDTISYHQEFKAISEDDFWNEIKNYYAYLPEEGLTSKDSIKLRDITGKDLNTSSKFHRENHSQYSSADKKCLDLPYKAQYDAGSTTSVKNSYIEESKIHNNGLTNRLDESEISNMDDFLRLKPHQVASNLLTAGLSTKAATKGNQDILVYKQGVLDCQNYSSFATSVTKEKKSEKPVILEKNFKPVYGTPSMQADMKDMDYDKLNSVLKKYHEYPERYRSSIWRYLLSLPLQKESFESYVKRDPHPAYQNLYKTYSIKSYRLYNKLVRILSALAYWSPIFGEVSFLPDLVYPFVRVLKSDDLVLFEVLMCFLMQH